MLFSCSFNISAKFTVDANWYLYANNYYYYEHHQTKDKYHDIKILILERAIKHMAIDV